VFASAGLSFVYFLDAPSNIVAQVEALRNNLMKDRSKHAAQMTALKKRLKGQFAE